MRIMSLLLWLKQFQKNFAHDLARRLLHVLEFSEIELLDCVRVSDQQVLEPPGEDNRKVFERPLMPSMSGISPFLGAKCGTLVRIFMCILVIMRIL